ncbi:MAG: lysine--tRNA ligase [Paenisporosarcina sp.]
MHWAYQLAERLIEKHPTKEVFTCASGISPSGSVHVGNFREVVTTFFVVKALESMGKKARFIFSWDDYDRLRKVPLNVSPDFESYVGLPYSEIPSPFGNGSYGNYFEKEFEDSLKQFGIIPEYIYQSNEYRSGRYSAYILMAMKKRKEIYDILMRFKSSKPSEDEREAFYPITLYCETCGKDTTILSAYDEVTTMIEYKCSCNHRGSQLVLASRKIKLNWKVDWAMRWMVEEVVFEPGGRDHSSATGSYNVSKVIAKEIFNYEAPEYVAYEFIGLKGTNQKMSSSSGNVITLRDLLLVYTPEIILYLFAKYKPSSAFNIGFDEEVLRNYSEYERHTAQEKGDEVTMQSLELIGTERFKKQPNFNQVAGIFPLIDFNIELLRSSLNATDEEYTFEEISTISNRVEHWIKRWNPQRLVQLNQEKNNTYFETLTIEQKEKVGQLATLISNARTFRGDIFMSEVYAICHQEDKKRMRECQKQLFQDTYQLVLKENSGPRLPLLLSAVGREKMIKLLTFN